MFEKSSPGKQAYKLPPLDVPAVDAAALLGDAHRKTPGLLPELSEIEIIRHFTRLSTWNYAIDLGMYPLGSCTMKYNPRVNEFVVAHRGAGRGASLPARIAGAGDSRNHRPAAALPASRSPAWTRLRCSRRPARMASSPGFCWCARGTSRRAIRGKKILIPDSAHGTNPATAAICGYQVENLKSNADGGIDLEALARQVDEDTAALMLTNPSTLGVFENQIHKIADILHAKGALLYMDGANMNALVGKVRPGDFGVDVMHLNLHKTFSTPHGGGGPGSGPVACKTFLEPFLLSRTPSP